MTVFPKNGVCLCGRLMDVRRLEMSSFIAGDESRGVGASFVLDIDRSAGSSMKCEAWDSAARTLLALSQGARVEIEGRIRNTPEPIVDVEHVELI